MYEVLRQIGPLVLLVVWFGGQVVLYIWYRVMERIYLQQFPPVGGVPLDMVLPGSVPSSGKSAIREALRLRQADPELERMRRSVRRRGLYMMLWIGGGFVAIVLVMPSWIAAVNAR